GVGVWEAAPGSGRRLDGFESGSRRVGTGRGHLKAPALGALQEPVELGSGGAGADAQATAPTLVGFQAFGLSGAGPDGVLGVLHGAGGEPEGELTAVCELVKQRGVVTDDGMLAVRARPAGPLDEVRPIGLTASQDEQVGAVWIVCVQTPQDALAVRQ